MRLSTLQPSLQANASAPSTQPSWLNEFHAFTLYHAIVLSICITSFIVFCFIGRKLLKQDQQKKTNRERMFRQMLGWSIVLSQSFFFIRRLTPEHWDIQDSLPMHLCRWVVWIAALAMLTLNPKMRALLLFWGIGLSTQAFFSPMITYGAGDLAFWIYWINHVQIVGAAIYDIVVLGYRPKRKDLYFAIIIGLIYCVFTVALNLILNTNYSYLGKGEHSAASVVDQLGPFPQRAVWMAVGSIVIFVLIYLCSIMMLKIRTKVFKRPPPIMITR